MPLVTRNRFHAEGQAATPFASSLTANATWQLASAQQLPLWKSYKLQNLSTSTFERIVEWNITRLLQPIRPFRFGTQGCRRDRGACGRGQGFGSSSRHRESTCEVSPHPSRRPSERCARKLLERGPAHNRTWLTGSRPKPAFLHSSSSRPTRLHLRCAKPRVGGNAAGLARQELVPAGLVLPSGLGVGGPTLAAPGIVEDGHRHHHHITIPCGQVEKVCLEVRSAPHTQHVRAAGTAHTQRRRAPSTWSSF